MAEIKPFDLESDFSQSWNRYAYTNGMPLEATHPLGLMRDGPSPCGPSAEIDGGDDPIGCGSGGCIWIMGVPLCIPSKGPLTPPSGNPPGPANPSNKGRGTSNPVKNPCPLGESPQPVTPAQGQQILNASTQLQNIPYSQQVCTTFVMCSINGAALPGAQPVHNAPVSDFFKSNPYFVKVASPQAGDVVLFNGHVALFDGSGTVLGAMEHNGRNTPFGSGLPRSAPSSYFGPVQGYYRLLVCG